MFRNELSSDSVSNSSRKYEIAVFSLAAMLSIICSTLEDVGSCLSINVQCCIGLIVYSNGMLRNQAEKSTDSRILINMDLDIFYPETVKSFRSRHIAVNPDHVWHRLDDTSYLERIGAASISDVDGKLHPTVVGLLMFGEEYKIRQEYPEYFLDYREMLDPSIRWTNRLEPSSGEWSGNLLDFFFQME